MALNGSEFSDKPWETAFSPFTDLFQTIFGNANAFYLLPIIILTMGIWYKTDNPIMASMFLMGSSGIFAMGTILAGVPEMSILFSIFTAIGISIIAYGLVFQKKVG